MSVMSQAPLIGYAGHRLVRARGSIFFQELFKMKASFEHKRWKCGVAPLILTERRNLVRSGGQNPQSEQPRSRIFFPPQDSL